MNATISLDGLWSFLQSLSLSDSSKDWLAERLLESKDVHRPYTIEELDERLFVAEEDFDKGNVLGTDEVMQNLQNFAKTL